MFTLKRDEFGNVDDIIEHILKAKGQEYETDIEDKEEEKGKQKNKEEKKKI